MELRSRHDPAGLVVGTLVTWRVSHLLVEEDGPGQVLTRVRAAVDATPLVGLLDCFGCTSIWVGALTSLGLNGRRVRPMDLALSGLAISGAAFCLQKLLGRSERSAWLPEPDIDSPLVHVHD